MSGIWSRTLYGGQQLLLRQGKHVLDRNVFSMNGLDVQLEWQEKTSLLPSAVLSRACLQVLGRHRHALSWYGHTGKALSSSTQLNLSLWLWLREKPSPSPPSCHEEAAEGIRSLILQ